MDKFKTLKLEVKPSMYMTTRFFYPHKDPEEAMSCTFKTFKTIDKAIQYANRYSVGLLFAGVQIQDENGKLVHEVTEDQDIYDYREA